MKYRIALTLFSAMLGLSIPVCAFADDSEVTAGAKDQTAQDIMISEAEAGMLEEGRVIILFKNLYKSADNPDKRKRPFK